MNLLTAGFAAFLLTAVLPVPSAGQTGKDPVVELRLMVIDGFGSPVPGRLTVTSDNDTVLYSGDSLRPAVLKVPPGNYRISYGSEFFKPTNREVILEKSDFLAVLTTHLESHAFMYPIDPVAITIKVTPGNACKAGDLLWAKLTAVFGDYSAERLIKPGGDSGVVLFEPVEPGTYILVIVDGQRIRAVTEVDANRSLTSISVPIRACEDK